MMRNLARRSVRRAGFIVLFMLLIGGVLLPTTAFAAPLPEPSQAKAAAQPNWSNCVAYHTVRRGETLSGIARWYGVSVQAIANANGIWNPSHIYAGQTLCIPGGWNPQPPPPNPCCQPPPQSCSQYWYVRPGDNLSRIAATCGTTVQNLVWLNGISNPSRIYVGQCIRIW